MKKIGIFVDGNEIIATGHIGRCLSIARALHNVVFIVSDERSKNIIEQMLLPEEKNNAVNCFDIIVLNSSYDNLESGVNTLIDCISHMNISALLVDSYFVTPDYFKTLHNALSSQGIKLIYLDDLKAFDHYDVDVIINYDASVTNDDYPSVRVKMLGNRYTPLRSQFENSAYVPSDKINKIFISAGGTDPYNIINKLIDCLPYELHILTSKLNKNYDNLIKISESDSRIKIYSGISDVATLMKDTDFAVCAGGTTLCELCAIGLPAVSYSLADNQLDFVNTFDRLSLIPYAGDVRPDRNPESTIKNIAASIEHYAAISIEDKIKLSNALKAHIDGLGAKRIAEDLLVHLHI